MPLLRIRPSSLERPLKFENRFSDDACHVPGSCGEREDWTGFFGFLPLDGTLHL